VVYSCLAQTHTTAAVRCCFPLISLGRRNKPGFAYALAVAVKSPKVVRRKINFKVFLAIDPTNFSHSIYSSRVVRTSGSVKGLLDNRLSYLNVVRAPFTTL
jgi:hypothetical protein